MILYDHSITNNNADYYKVEHAYNAFIKDHESTESERISKCTNDEI